MIIPVYNGAATIEKCLEAAFGSAYDRFEVVVVDDGSTDDTVAIVQKFPCRLIRLAGHAGAGPARNVGARQARGDLFFFVDADCLLAKDALALAAAMLAGRNDKIAIGGTYTRMPSDSGFFSIFQSVFINYFETKDLQNPDYLATHAMIIRARQFRASGGFAEDFLPILEDVEFSHRLRRQGFKLVMTSDILVRHIFNYSLRKSMANAVRKSRFWMIYSLKNQDLLADSGTASRELKFNVAAYFVILALAALGLIGRQILVVYPLALVLGCNIMVNKKLFMAFKETGGRRFALGAALYYLGLYPAAVGWGAGTGLILFMLKISSSGPGQKTSALP